MNPEVLALAGGPARMICHEPAAGDWNMAVDQVLAASAGTGGRPVIRLYGFHAPTVSIGRFQPATDIDRDRLQTDGVNLVRRPSGGRAVLHAAEITYSVALGREHLNPFTKRAVYRFVGDLLLDILTKFGVVCRRNDAQIGDAADPNCFSTVGEYEVVGRYGKLVGSAQMVTRQGILQHGSIPLDQTYQLIQKYLKTTTLMNGPSTSWLSREVERSSDFSFVNARLRRNLEQALPSVEACDLDTAETQRVAELLPRYAGTPWTLEGRE